MVILGRESMLLNLNAHLDQLDDAGLAAAVAIIEQLRIMQDRFVSQGLLAHDRGEPLARVALTLARSATLSEVGNWVVLISQSRLAGTLGLTTGALHNQLTDLRRRGIIDTGYRRLIVRDMDTLRRIGGLNPDEESDDA